MVMEVSVWYIADESMVMVVDVGQPVLGLPGLLLVLKT
jgi:hypothetical protein